ncbi:hypothetical protein BJ508DRAFT_92864 [Ascobolus immersus RN42]|uniref:Uncharacterized protein n=1 Tax=Ascobolus immersus RN42 TaxID=1160509 RepID=A0A3N4IBZ6_ASCIM|nr:hypothetical protein BJ508DRAFT_92864 [Ascobolus immersus RN42]
MKRSHTPDPADVLKKRACLDNSEEDLQGIKDNGGLAGEARRDEDDDDDDEPMVDVWALGDSEEEDEYEAININAYIPLISPAAAVPLPPFVWQNVPLPPPTAATATGHSHTLPPSNASSASTASLTVDVTNQSSKKTFPFEKVPRELRCLIISNLQGTTLASFLRASRDNLELFYDNEKWIATLSIESQSTFGGPSMAITRGSKDSALLRYIWGFLRKLCVETKHSVAEKLPAARRETWTEYFLVFHTQYRISVIADFLCVVQASYGTVMHQGPILQKSMAGIYSSFDSYGCPALQSRIGQLLLQPTRNLHPPPRNLSPVQVAENWVTDIQVCMQERLYSLSLLNQNTYDLPPVSVMQRTNRFDTKALLLEWTFLLELGMDEKAAIDSVLQTIAWARRATPPPVFLPALNKIGLHDGMKTTQIECLADVDPERQNELQRLAKEEPWRGLGRVRLSRLDVNVDMIKPGFPE